MANSFGVLYKPTFVRSFKKLPTELQEEILSTTELLKDRKNHKKLRVHKLTGRLSDCYSCSVNYSHRIIFVFESNDTLVLLDVGSHDVYK